MILSEIRNGGNFTIPRRKARFRNHQSGSHSLRALFYLYLDGVCNFRLIRPTIFRIGSDFGIQLGSKSLDQVGFGYFNPSDFGSDRISDLFFS